MLSVQSDDKWKLYANEVRVLTDKDQPAATLQVSALSLMGPDAGVYTQAEICVSKLCFRKMHLSVSNHNATDLSQI